MTDDKIESLNDLSANIFSELTGKDDVTKLDHDHDTNIMDIKLFYLFENEQNDAFGGKKDKKEEHEEGQKDFSLRDIKELSQIELSKMIFAFDKSHAKEITSVNEPIQKQLELAISRSMCMQGIGKEFILDFKYIQFKKSLIMDITQGTRKNILCFQDISQKILYDSSKAESELLTLINTTISHEMRNPLNSIIN